MHSGLSHDDITAWVDKRAEGTSREQGRVTVMLLDEINACNSVGEWHGCRSKPNAVKSLERFQMFVHGGASHPDEG